MDTDNRREQLAEWRGIRGSFLGPLATAPHIEGAPFAILPIGATEQHGSLLPVGMDSIVVTELAMAVGEQLGGYVLPTIPIGTSMEHRGGAGTAWLSPATLRLVVRDIANSISHGGITSLVIINGHGGNFVLGPTVRELNTEFPDRRALLVPERIHYGPDRDADELHVDSGEMSLGCYLLGLDPPGPGADFVPDAHRDELNITPLLKLSPSGVWGRPSRASADRGRKEFHKQIERIAAFVQEQFGDGDAWRTQPPDPTERNDTQANALPVRSEGNF